MKKKMNTINLVTDCLIAIKYESDPMIRTFAKLLLKDTIGTASKVRTANILKRL